MPRTQSIKIQLYFFANFALLRDNNDFLNFEKKIKQ